MRQKSTTTFGGVRVAHLFRSLCCPIMCRYVPRSVLWCPWRFPHKKRCSVRLYLQLFVGGLMFYLHRLCIVLSNTYCVVCLFSFFVLCTLCCQFLWIVHFWLVLLYSLNIYYGCNWAWKIVQMRQKSTTTFFYAFSHNFQLFDILFFMLNTITKFLFCWRDRSCKCVLRESILPLFLRFLN